MKTVTAAPPASMEYAPAAYLRPLTGLYWFAIACGALPMLAGLAVFLLYYVTDQDAFAVAGIGVILLGIVLFVAGFICLIVYAWRQRRITGSFKPIAGWFGIVAVLLLANFPLAFVLMGAGLQIRGEYRVQITNDGSTLVDRFTISGLGANQTLGPIPPGITIKSRFSIQAEGTLSYTMTSATSSTTTSGVVDDYATLTMGNFTQVNISGNTVKIVRAPHRD